MNVIRRIRHQAVRREHCAAQTREARNEGTPPVRMDPCVRDPWSYDKSCKVTKERQRSPRKQWRMIRRRICRQARQRVKMWGWQMPTDDQELDILSTVG